MEYDADVELTRPANTDEEHEAFRTLREASEAAGNEGWVELDINII